MEPDLNKRRGLFLRIECVNTINEGLMIHHESHGCSKPFRSRYLDFQKRTFSSSMIRIKNGRMQNATKQFPTPGLGRTYYLKIHTLFSPECSAYFDWQTVGFFHNFTPTGGKIMHQKYLKAQSMEQWINIGPKLGVVSRLIIKGTLKVMIA